MVNTRPAQQYLDWIGGFLPAMLLTLSLAGTCAAQSKSDVAWRNHLDSALEHARETGKPVLIEFWASWCGPCRKMDMEVWPNARVVELSKKFVCIGIDLDRDNFAATRYAVREIPTIVLADPWGLTITRRHGFVHVTELTSMMEEMPADYTEVKQWRDILERDRKNGEALSRVGQFYQKNRAYVLSNQYYNDALKTKEIKANPEVRQDMQIAVGLNQIRLGDFGGAHKWLEDFAAEFPDGKRLPEALVGLVFVHIKMKKLADAEKTAAAIEAKYPASQASKTAKDLIAQARNTPGK